MPLRIARIKRPGVDPLQAAITATALTRDLVSTLQFPPATAAVSVLLLILQTIQNVQINRAGCDRLARRAAQILLDIDDQMRGRYDDAPEMLIRNLDKFESILTGIHQFMAKLADSKWSDRFLRRAAIDDALVEYTRMLDEAAQSFQLATLINIHLAISSLRGNTATARMALEAPPPPTYQEIATEPDSDTIEIQSPEVICAAQSLVAVCEPPVTPGEALSPPDKSVIDHYLPEDLSSLTLEDDHGFRRYHQSEVTLCGRSRLKEGWWAGAIEVQVQGQQALIKKYDVKDRAYRDWLRDVKLLQNLYHPNLPQMLGISDDRARTPFILLANVQTQTPQVLVRDMLRSSSLGICMETMLRFYRDLTDTIMYVQRQLNLNENKLQDFIEASSFRVDSLKTLVVGLPPPRDGVWHSARSYGLSHTLVNACLKMLPNEGRVSYSSEGRDESVTKEMQMKINHLVTLARALLPRDRQSPVLPEKLEALIEETESKPSSLTLRKIRNLTLNAEDGHNHTWYERNVPADKFFVGDIGYVPAGEDFASFVLLCNVIKDGKVAFSTTQESRGEHWCWEQSPIRRQPVQAFEMPGFVAGWPIAVPPYTQIDMAVVHEAHLLCVQDAWQYLLENGKDCATNAGIRPEELILVTHVGTHQDFYVKDFRPKPFMPRANAADPHFAATPFQNQQQINNFHRPPGFGINPFDQASLPTITYLFTSLDPGHQPYWSSSPVFLSNDMSRKPLERNFVTKIGWKTGYLHYVQLLDEDFETTV